MTGFDKREFGDFQTPEGFALQVCDYLANNIDFIPDVILEPTCGIGNFLNAASMSFKNARLVGVDINEDYLNACLLRLENKQIQTYCESIFDFNYNSCIKKQDKLLIVGNPPWVTNSELSSLNSLNLPKKRNSKGLKGVEALTGSSNFDISEYIILDLLDKFNDSNDALLAMLCKTTVAINIIKEIRRRDLSVSHIKVVKFEAKKIFNVAVDACLLILRIEEKKKWGGICEIFNISNPQKLISRMGYINNKFYINISDNDAIKIDGKSCFVWRQGIKHDCSKVMELSENNNELVNGWGDILEIEKDLVYPLLKSSHIRSYNYNQSFIKYVIVTQKKVGQETKHIADQYPKTWNYLMKHKSKFDARKSSIYRNAPKFSMFGIGDYSYVKYKIVISGFYKEPIFKLVYSDKAIMVDDTCYFIGFKCYENAKIAKVILNSRMVKAFLKSIVNLDSKRPYTKKILERIDFNLICSIMTYEDLRSEEIYQEEDPTIREEDYGKFKNLINNNEQLKMVISSQ